MKKSLCFIAIVAIMFSLSACGKTAVEWNGKTEEMANLLFDDRAYDTALLNECTEYIEHEIPYDRERCISVYDSGAN